jgi:hypothetical protein
MFELQLEYCLPVDSDALQVLAYGTAVAVEPEAA